MGTDNLIDILICLAVVAVIIIIAVISIYVKSPSSAFPKRKYKVGVCVRGEPLIWKV